MELFTIENFTTLIMLVALQAVLGFDNLLYISLESQKVDPAKQAQVRKLGIGLAVLLRLVLLGVIMKAISSFQDPFFKIDLIGYFSGTFNFHSIIVLAGGIFIIYTAMKEISHMLIIEDIGHNTDTSRSTVFRAVSWIVIMNLIFSFDSILSAIALSDVFAVMATGIITGGILMIWLADKVASFLQKNRMYEVLGLFILFIVGIMLVSEGGHLAHLKLFTHPVEPMAKSTFYFVIFTIVIIEIVQGKYQKKLLSERTARAAQTA
jgi:predicted tellurium resistance membrane protein TerC